MRRKLGDPDGGRFYAERSVEVFKIWEDVFGGRERLVRVLGSQFVNAWLSEQILTWKNTYKNADVLAVAPYFGNEFGDPKIAPLSSRMTTDQLMKRLDDEIKTRNRDHIVKQAQLAGKYGLQLVAFEGGQHLVGYGGAENNNELTRLFCTANRDPAWPISIGSISTTGLPPALAFTSSTAMSPRQQMGLVGNPRIPGSAHRRSTEVSRHHGAGEKGQGLIEGLTRQSHDHRQSSPVAARIGTAHTPGRSRG